MVSPFTSGSGSSPDWGHCDVFLGITPPSQWLFSLRCTALLQSTPVLLELEVEDENDNSPQCTESVYQVAITENANIINGYWRI